MRGATWLTGAVAAVLLAGCSTPPGEAPPAPVPAPAPPPAPAAPPPPPSPPGWEDSAATPGDWRYAAAPAPEAIYGEASATRLSLRCDAAGRRIVLTRPDAAAGAALTVRTTYTTRTLTAGVGGAAFLLPDDPLLDAMVASRGRFAVETPGLPPLTLPTWPEPGRVVEDCREGA